MFGMCLRGRMQAGDDSEVSEGMSCPGSSGTSRAMRGPDRGWRASSLSSMSTCAILGLNLRSHCCTAFTLSRDFHDPKPPVASRLSCMRRNVLGPHPRVSTGIHNLMQPVQKLHHRTL